MILRMRAIVAAGGVICAVISVAGSSARAADLSSVVSARTEFDGASRTATVYITNTGRAAIIGGGLRVAFRYSDGSEKNSDGRFDLLPSVGLENKFTATDSAMHVGALEPGQTYRIQQIAPPAPRDAAVVGATGEVRAVVFMDNTAMGDAQCINEIFERWRDQALTFSAWYKKSGELLSQEGGAAALQQLSSDAATMLARHPATEPRLRSAPAGTAEEALTRDAGVLQYLVHLTDQVRSRVDAHRMSVVEGSTWLREYLRIRTDTTAAHTQRKEGN
jgi:hypothetical protein